MSRTSQYAIQALVYLAIQPCGMRVTVRDIAYQLNVPAAYLAKIMQTLNKDMFLSARRGRLGGVYLAAGAEAAGLLEILAHTERGLLVHECLLGLKTCSDEAACPMHGAWQPIKQTIIELLQECTLQRLAEDVRSGCYQLADLPQAAVSQAWSQHTLQGRQV
ncbi:hypothetical protein CAP31_00800 [Sulfuriferula sp. AH1]|uniref:RrF2 family transcriptional regulator n=1 Tax=Sulfuriferula sp. AH1 TaxID=1985873 RepID=UPI000B3B163F|nr:Rrf2 family transcriptional regulator [Sulfuriferula sp. AH1]ARU30358.1 hypothetical protein CAP31_00800 [Sulfuriferula sp. AH1]